MGWYHWYRLCVRHDAGIEEVIEFFNDFIFVGGGEILKDMDGNVVITWSGSFATINRNAEFVFRDWSIQISVVILAIKVERKIFMIDIRFIEEVKEKMGLMIDVGDNGVVGDRVLFTAHFLKNIVHAFVISTILIDLLLVAPDGGFDLSFELASKLFVLQTRFS